MCKEIASIFEAQFHAMAVHLKRAADETLEAHETSRVTFTRR